MLGDRDTSNRRTSAASVLDPPDQAHIIPPIGCLYALLVHFDGLALELYPDVHGRSLFHWIRKMAMRMPHLVQEEVPSRAFVHTTLESRAAKR